MQAAETTSLLDILSAHIWVVVPLGLFLFMTIAAVAENIRKASQTRSREESRREIAAYVAEGSMTPQDAALLLDAGEKGRHRRRPCA